jgi:hypothetical protein
MTVLLIALPMALNTTSSEPLSFPKAINYVATYQPSRIFLKENKMTTQMHCGNKCYRKWNKLC